MALVLVLTGRYRPVSLSVYMDNDMPVVFGTGQGVVTASANSWLGLGEQLTVTTAGLPDKDFVSEFPTRRYMGGTFGIPIGIDGWKFEMGGTDGITTPRVDPLAATKGIYNEGYAKLSYELLKRRDYELTVNERLDAANEEIRVAPLFMPALPQSEDRVRPLRTGANGILRLRESGTTVIYGANYSRGLDAPSARAPPRTPRRCCRCRARAPMPCSTKSMAISRLTRPCSKISSPTFTPPDRTRFIAPC